MHYTHHKLEKISSDFAVINSCKATRPFQDFNRKYTRTVLPVLMLHVDARLIHCNTI